VRLDATASLTLVATLAGHQPARLLASLQAGQQRVLAFTLKPLRKIVRPPTDDFELPP